jgi:tetratricopeptide (TPR) repeat protein
MQFKPRGWAAFEGLGCVLFLVVLFAATAKAGAPALGRDALEVHRFEDHNEALAHWARQGIRDAVLVNLDAHDDMRVIPDSRISLLRLLYEQDAADLLSHARTGGESSLYHVGNFIYAASRLGIVGKVFWVIPFSYFEEPDPDVALREFLRRYAFPEEDIRSFHLKDGLFQGLFQGIPLVICDVHALPEVDSPLILSVDVDFFPPFARARGMDLTTAVYSVVGELFKKEYRVKDAFVAYSVNGGYLSPLHRWAGDLCRGLLEQPERIRVPPSSRFHWKQRAETLYEEDKAEALLNVSLNALERLPGDPGLKLYAAFGSLGLGDTDRAYFHAKTACLEDSGYCAGLADIGQCLIDQGRLDEALPFFEAAYSLQPDMNYRLKNLADALEEAGRKREALRYHEINEARNGVFPAAFRIGCIHLDLEERDSAARAFRRGIAAVKDDPYIEARYRNDAEALRRAAVFFEKSGMHETASALKNHPVLGEVFVSGEMDEHSPEGSGSGCR